MPPRPMPPHIQTMMFNVLKHHEEEALERCKQKEKERMERENEKQKVKQWR